jgi:outer membrane murein-binding lipoprotein Lpp
MKYTYIFLVLLLIMLSSCSQSRKDMNARVNELMQKVDTLSSKVDMLTEQNSLLDEEISWLENEIVDLNRAKPANPANPAAAVSAPATKTSGKQVKSGQCKALTSTGSRCSRIALNGSEFCWQHIKIYEPDRSEKENKTAVSPGDTSTYTIHTGPKGGKYYINSSGKKIYIKK